MIDALKMGRSSDAIQTLQEPVLSERLDKNCLFCTKKMVFMKAGGLLSM